MDDPTGTTATRGERGVALLEFAIVLPLFLMLVLGMVTGGRTYGQKNSISNATREASRQGATLPVSASMATWLRTVVVQVRTNATGDLDDSVAGRRICVAYVHPAGDSGTVDPNDSTRSVVVGAGPIPATLTPVAGRCTNPDGSTFDDGIADTTQRRVNIVVSRSGEIETGVFRMPLTLQSRAATRFEAVP